MVLGDNFLGRVRSEKCAGSFYAFSLASEFENITASGGKNLVVIT